jgi:hypothetical protein
VLSTKAGLDVYDSEICEECGVEVGENSAGKFVSFVVLLDDESEWIVCANCASPVL